MCACVRTRVRACGGMCADRGKLPLQDSLEAGQDPVTPLHNIFICANTFREIQGGSRQKKKKKREKKGRSETETRASSGPMSLERACGILSVTRPSLGCLNLARQEKLQVTTPQASLTEKLVITSTLSVCVHSNLFSLQGNAVKRSRVQDSKRSRMLAYHNKCMLFNLKRKGFRKCVYLLVCRVK